MSPRRFGPPPALWMPNAQGLSKGRSVGMLVPGGVAKTPVRGKTSSEIGTETDGAVVSELPKP